MRILKWLGLTGVCVFINGALCTTSDAVEPPLTETSSKKIENEDYKNFIQDIGNQVIHILVNKKKSLSERQEAFRRVVDQYFDMPAIGKFVLGRYWRQATPKEQIEYLDLFETSIVESYSHQFENYNNETLRVESARVSSAGGMIVTSKIIRPAGTPPLQVDWKVFDTKKGLRILDVIVNGVSMSLTYRTQYANAYNSHGGTMGGLLQAMKSENVVPTPTPE